MREDTSLNGLSPFWHTWSNGLSNFCAWLEKSWRIIEMYHLRRCLWRTSNSPMWTLLLLSCKSFSFIRMFYWGIESYCQVHSTATSCQTGMSELSKSSQRGSSETQPCHGRDSIRLEYSKVNHTMVLRANNVHSYARPGHLSYNLWRDARVQTIWRTRERLRKEREAPNGYWVWSQCSEISQGLRLRANLVRRLNRQDLLWKNSRHLLTQRTL